MKKFIIAAAIVLTTGLLTITTKNNTVKTVRATATVAVFDQSVLGTAD